MEYRIRKSGDGKKLSKWVCWLFTEDKWTCGICRNAQDAGFKPYCPGIEDRKDDCPEHVQKPLPYSETVFHDFIEPILPALFNGMGGVNIDAIRYRAEVLGLSQGTLLMLSDFSMVIIQAIREAQAENDRRKRQIEQG